MRVIFQTLKNVDGLQAVVRGRNACGEYVVSLYDRTGWQTRAVSTYFTGDRDDACGTAILMMGKV